VRVKTIMAKHNIATEEEAQRLVKQTDENWNAYIKQVYGHDRNLAGHYDMMLDTGRLGYQATVDVILAALKGKS
jgi:cytidylate kinase